MTALAGTAPIPRVLSIAGTDPTGGAGLHADLKSIAANGGYGMGAVTALVAQNTHGVRAVHIPPASFLRDQLEAVSDDVTIDAVKIGMLATAEIVRVVQEWLDRVSPPVVVLDPVMVSTSGDRLLDGDAEDALRELCARADVLTPNMSELAVLAREPLAASWCDVVDQAVRVSSRNRVRVLAKGGHLEGDRRPDALVDATGATPQITEFPGARVVTPHTHGTGCSLSSALATRFAISGRWEQATAEAKQWLTESLRRGAELNVGTGNGPISHFAGLWDRGGISPRPTPTEVETAWWEDVRPIRDSIDALPFVRGLGDGTLDREAFAWYLAQDALYLRDYARVLAEASRLAPTIDEQAFWAQSAHEAVASEIQLHQSWISADTLDRVQPSPTTTAYLNHVLAMSARGSYRALIAALLPCFWLYEDIGTRLRPLSHPAHPYRSWIDSYADAGFAEASRRAVSIVAAAAATAPPAERTAMQTAFRISATHELAFFAAPTGNSSDTRPVAHALHPTPFNTDEVEAPENAKTPAEAGADVRHEGFEPPTF